MGVLSKKAKFKNVLDRKINKQLPESPFELLPFEFGLFRLQELKKQMVNLNYSAQFTLYSTVLKTEMSSALVNFLMTFLSALHINC